MTSDRSFKRNWVKASWLVILGAVIGAVVRVAWIQGQPRIYVSAAKLTLSPVIEASPEDNLTESTALFAAKQEARHQLEGGELQERALRRFLSLEQFNGRKSSRPNVTPRIETSEGSEPAILMVRAFGAQPALSRGFLDSVLDEFMYFADSEALKASSLGGFRVTVLERASGAIGENRDLWFPAVVFGITGGLCGFALSLCLADLMTRKQASSVSPDPKPSVTRPPPQASFYQTSSRFSGLVLIGMSLGASIQLLRLSGDEQATFLVTKLRAESRADDHIDSHRDRIASTVEMAARSLESEDGAIRTYGRIRFMSPGTGIGNVRIKAVPDTDSATLEVRAFGDDPAGTQMFLETLMGEFAHQWESNNIRLTTVEPPTWMTLKPQDKTWPITLGAVVGGMAGFSLALLIASLIRAARPRASPPALPTTE